MSALYAQLTAKIVALDPTRSEWSLWDSYPALRATIHSIADRKLAQS
jgi:hypothetical protein